jgi:hypothetical protein
MSKRFLASILTSIFIIMIVLLSLHAQPARAEITAAILVSPTGGLFTDENGSSDTFFIELDSQPASNVKIDLTSSDLTEGTVSPASITFSQGTWDKVRTIEITGVADGIQDGDVLYQITGTVTSADPLFDSLEMPVVSVTNINDAIPIANDDFPPINGNSPIVIPVLQNDFALDDLPLQLDVISEPTHGSYVVNPAPDNTITYTPSQSFLGIDQFSYSVCDGDGDCASASVSISDQLPPNLIWISPVSTGDTYEIVDEIITLEVSAQDNFQVDCVEFLRWDAIAKVFHNLDNVCQPPYATLIDGHSLNMTWNQIFARAVDVAGNFSDFETIWIFRRTHSYIPLIRR